MDIKSLLIQPQSQQSGLSLPPALDYRDFQRSIVLLSSGGAGSHFLKLLLVQFAVMLAPGEPFNPHMNDERFYTLSQYLDERDPKPRIMTDGYSALQHFLACFYRTMPSRAKIVLDIKYQHAYVFGVNASMRIPSAVPIVLEELHKRQVPFIHWMRRDLVAQAVSVLVAEADRTVLSKGEAPIQTFPSLRLSPRDVLVAANKLRNGQENAKQVMEALGVTPLVVIYEDFSESWRETIRQVLRFSGRYADIPDGFLPQLPREEGLSRVANLSDIRDYVAKRDRTLIA
jgi:hypothetical protein